jgi:hypothetical protein
MVTRDALLRALIQVDDLLARTPWMQQNLIRLVWGFDKPPTTHRTD